MKLFHHSFMLFILCKGQEVLLILQFLFPNFTGSPWRCFWLSKWFSGKEWEKHISNVWLFNIHFYLFDIVSSPTDHLTATAVMVGMAFPLRFVMLFYHLCSYTYLSASDLVFTHVPFLWAYELVAFLCAVFERKMRLTIGIRLVGAILWLFVMHFVLYLISCPNC